MPRVPYLLALLCLPLVVGCEGCRRDSEDEDPNKPDAPIEDFSSRPAIPFPGDSAPSGNGVKPGHWLTASQSLKSNKVDARGQLQSQVSGSSSNFQSGETQGVRGDVESLRPIVLPKGQQRRFDYRLLAPIVGNQDQRRIFLSSRFVSAGRAVFYDTGKQPINAMLPEEYFFVVLTSRPERFARFQTSYWARPFRDESFEFSNRPAINYRLVFPPTKDLLPLSETMLDWTSTAVVFWDDLSPDALTPDQQQALADWVHFGGLLVVNGAPASNSIVQTSLADLLPLTPSSNIELDSDAATELLNSWAVKEDSSTEKQIAQLKSQASRVAVDGTPADDLVAIDDTGQLIVTRRVGRGRVMQPRFDITSDWMASWESYDSFINSAILGRPRREFLRSEDATEIAIIAQRYSDFPAMRSDPAINTKFRIAARDAILPSKIRGQTSTHASPSRLDPLSSVQGAAGIGGWNPRSDAVLLCREILSSESGIEIPDVSLVVRSLGYYLLILVPINYLVFRLLGRLEYAWLAVPLIAIGGAVWVARAARLDIGFARKQTEIALLELQPNYQRGHLTRVMAIYNSLSSTYDVEFGSIDGVALPISDGDENVPTFRTSFAEGPILAGLAIDSNKTRVIHTEQMIDIGGSIEISANGDLINQSNHELFDAFVVEKTDGKLRIATVGAFTPGSTAKLRFKDIEAPQILDEPPMQTIRPITRLCNADAMPDNSMRLVGRIDGSMPGMTVTPDASQVDAQTVVLAHLKHAPTVKPQKDKNLISQFRAAIGRELDDEQQDDSQ